MQSKTGVLLLFELSSKMVAFLVNTVQRKILLVEILVSVNKLSYLATDLEG